MEKESLYIKCDCHGEVLEIQAYDYSDTHPNDTGFYMSMWRMSSDSHKMSWRERFRWCWQILRTGDPWNDYIMLTKENAKKVSQYIEKNL